MIDLCQYKNSLGVPGEGFHSWRIFNIAVNDVLGTLIGAFILAYFTRYSFPCTLIFLFTLGIILHHLFCVKTTVDKLLFGDC